MYATPQDMISRFGSDELVQLTVRGPVAVPEEALESLVKGEDMDAFSAEVRVAAQAALDAIEDALEDARAEIDPHLQARYRLPLQTVPRVIHRITLEVARYILHGDVAPDPVTRRYRDMLGLLKSIARGETQLGLDATDQRTRPQGGVSMKGSEPGVTGERLEGYLR